MATTTKARAAKPVSAATQAVLDQMQQDANGGLATEDKLEKVRDEVRKLRDLEKSNEDLANQIAENSAAIRLLKEKTLVEMLDGVGINSIGVNAEGNHPPYDITIGDYFHARIPDENQDRAYSWLKETKNEDLIQTKYTVSFGRGDIKAAEKFEKLLIKSKEAYDKKESVPWNTFEAFLRGEFKKKPLTQKVMDMLGATTGRIVKVVKPKKEKK